MLQSSLAERPIPAATGDADARRRSRPRSSWPPPMTTGTKHRFDSGRRVEAIHAICPTFPDRESPNCHRSARNPSSLLCTRLHPGAPSTASFGCSEPVFGLATGVLHLLIISGGGRIRTCSDPPPEPCTGSVRSSRFEDAEIECNQRRGGGRAFADIDRDPPEPPEGVSAVPTASDPGAQTPEPDGGARSGPPV